MKCAGTTLSNRSSCDQVSKDRIAGSKSNFFHSSAVWTFPKCGSSHSSKVFISLRSDRSGIAVPPRLTRARNLLTASLSGNPSSRTPVNIAWEIAVGGASFQILSLSTIAPRCSWLRASTRPALFDHEQLFCQ